MNDILQRLTTMLEQRKQIDADDSYVAILHRKGLNKILEKLGEECNETIIAAKDAQHSGNNRDVIYETADLWFHSLVLLSHLGEEANDVLVELDRRFGTSGIEEKNQRNTVD